MNDKITNIYVKGFIDDEVLDRYFDNLFIELQEREDLEDCNIEQLENDIFNELHKKAFTYTVICMNNDKFLYGLTTVTASDVPIQK